MEFVGLDMLRGTANASQSSTWQQASVWLKKRARLLLASVVLVALVFLTSGAGSRTIENIKTLVSNAAFSSMVLDRVHFAGLGHTQNQQINQAIALSQGTPMLKLDLVNIKTQVEQLPWVKSASVNRQFPDSLFVSIVEREPFALWQIDGEVWLVDADGTKITKDNLGSFANMPFIVGSGAPENYNKLSEILASEPALNAVVDSVIRVGNRRWDVMFTSGTRLRLPEESANYPVSAAWHRFAQMQRDHDLLSREVAIYDMRISDRIIVTLTKRGERAPLALGDDI